MLARLLTTGSYLARPFRLLRVYRPEDLRPDLVAGLTVAVILLPQAIAYALIAELPPQVGLFTAVVAAITGALWGSSNHLQTGPTNAASLLVLSTLLPIAAPGSPGFLVAAGLMAVMVGVFRLLMGLAHLGLLVNFVSDSVIIGFTAGAGVLISANQLRALLRLDFPSSPGLVDTLQAVVANLSESHLLSLILGLSTIVLIAGLIRFSPKLPASLFGMLVASAAVAVLGLSRQGIQTIGELPRTLPPLAQLPLLNLELVGQLSTGALAVGAIGLVEAMSIARAISSQTGQRLDSNQEFIGQGISNIASGLLSGYTCSGSFSRSAINYKSGARTPFSSVFSGLFVMFMMLVFAPLTAYVPRTALAGVLIVTAYGMVDRREIARIWRGAKGDVLIMVITFLATLFLPLQFAVLTGILISFAVYILRTSVPRVICVLPDEDFRHFTYQPEKPFCPQLAIFDILGDLYFGAVSHVEKAIHDHLARHPGQRFILLRMHSVNYCDISGIHALESILNACRDRGGDMFFVRVRKPVREIMGATGFYRHLGEDHFLPEDEAVSHLFYRVIDPAICIYECEVRAFLECQNLPKQVVSSAWYPLQTQAPLQKIAELPAVELWKRLREPPPPMVIDVREPREYHRGHIPQALLIPLPRLLAAVLSQPQDGGEGPPDDLDLPHDLPLVFVCRGGRRSVRAASAFISQGHPNVWVLQGGMLAWEAAGLLEAVADEPQFPITGELPPG